MSANKAKDDLRVHLRAAMDYANINDWDECERMLAACMARLEDARAWSTRYGAKVRERRAVAAQRERVESMAGEGAIRCNR